MCELTSSPILEAAVIVDSVPDDKDLPPSCSATTKLEARRELVLAKDRAGPTLPNKRIYD